jgi:uncharacterized membrane protein
MTATQAFTLAGALLIVAGIPLMLRIVPPNRWYGVRTRATKHNPQVWYAASAASGRDALVFGVIELSLALLLPRAGARWIVYVVINATALLCGAIIVSVVAIMRARRIAAHAQRRPV